MCAFLNECSVYTCVLRCLVCPGVFCCSTDIMTVYFVHIAIDIHLLTIFFVNCPCPRKVSIITCFSEHPVGVNVFRAVLVCFMLRCPTKGSFKVFCFCSFRSSCTMWARVCDILLAVLLAVVIMR